MPITISDTSINNLTVPTSGSAGTLLATGSNYPLNIDSSATANSIQIDSSGRLIDTTMPYIGGTIGDGGGSGDKAIGTPLFNRGFTVTSDAIVVPLTGQYFVSWSQLVSTNGNSQYYSVKRNGVGLKFAYSLGNQYNDLGLALILECSANDYIAFNFSTTSTYSWQGAHSNWSIFFLG